MKIKLIALVIIVSCIGINCNYVNAKEELSYEEIVDEIVEVSGLPLYVVEKDIDKLSKQSSQDKEIIASLLLDEVIAGTDTNNSSLATRSSGEGSITLKKSKYGDLWYSKAYTLVWKHGHIGLYEEDSVIIEARGPGYTVAARNVNNMKGYSGDKILGVTSVKNSTTRIDYTHRMSATAWAKKKKGKSYAYTLDNKTCGDHDYNCSQLVWCAYKNSSAKLDLDNNGGFFVAPYDIEASPYTYTIYTY